MNRSSSKKRTTYDDHGFVETIFSWSLEDIFNEDLYKDKVEESCEYCSLQTDAVKDDKTYQRLLSKLNESQYKAICACLSSFQCYHKSTVDLIWGPPGTGKTKTLGTLLFVLLKMNHRTLVCAPTNVAVKEVASRVLSMVRESFDRNSEALFCALGDMIISINDLVFVM
ncbi:Regulator of nonsense transcripts 1-like [Spatholobus suberectus]|nr:Regulator of nonsense transcripts 1-like [Spatholobus suberectus]